MTAVLNFYIKYEQGRGGLDIAHFNCLTDAIAAYKVLPARRRKALGVQAEGRSADLARCVPIHLDDEEGEDVIVLDYLHGGFTVSRPAILKAAQDLADCLHVRYCLYRDCLLKVPETDKLPKGLQGRYLWPAEPGKLETAIQWIKVVGVGSLSPSEFKRRFRSSESAADTYPLVLRLNVHSRTENGRFQSLDVTPWEYVLLVKCSKERFQNKKIQGGPQK